MRTHVDPSFLVISNETLLLLWIFTTVRYVICLTTNHISIYEYVSHLAVKPFIIGDGLTNIVVKKGQVIKYDIKFGGEPEPVPRWEQDGKELFEDNQER